MSRAEQAIFVLGNRGVIKDLDKLLIRYSIYVLLQFRMMLITFLEVAKFHSPKPGGRCFRLLADNTCTEQ